MLQIFAHKRLALCLSLLVISSMLTACGFHLRQSAPLAFKTVHLKGTTFITPTLKKAFKEQDIRIVTEAEDAELQLDLLKEESEKRILSLSGTGVVREYELYYRVQFRTKLAGASIWTLPVVIESRRDFTYNDSALLAKGVEERMLIDAMHTEVASNLMRRLSALKKAQ